MRLKNIPTLANISLYKGAITTSHLTLLPHNVTIARQKRDRTISEIKENTNEDVPIKVNLLSITDSRLC